jgi:hypothetical protein
MIIAWDNTTDTAVSKPAVIMEDIQFDWLCKICLWKSVEQNITKYW